MARMGEEWPRWAERRTKVTTLKRLWIKGLREPIVESPTISQKRRDVEHPHRN
jgi:hypothetical protein